LHNTLKISPSAKRLKIRVFRPENKADGGRRPSFGLKNVKPSDKSGSKGYRIVLILPNYSHREPWQASKEGSATVFPEPLSSAFEDAGQGEQGG
jgi:hypothetical protein